MAETTSGQAKLAQMIASGTSRNAAMKQLINEQKQTAAQEKTYAPYVAVYKPQEDYLTSLETKAQERYAKNQANISNLFGALTSLGATDTAAIKKQFTDSIAAQQLSLSERTATAKAEQTAGEKQVTATGAERGTGPAIVGSPTATATAEGIAASNAYQTQWEGLQNAMQNQAVIDIANRQAGYGQQEIGALDTLRQGYETQLTGLAGQRADLASNIAQAKLGVQQSQAQAAADAALAEQRFQQDIYLQQMKDSAAMARKSAGGSSTPKAKKYANTPVGFSQQATDAGVDIDALSGYIDQATTKATASAEYAANIKRAKLVDPSAKPGTPQFNGALTVYNQRVAAGTIQPIKAAEVTKNDILKALPKLPGYSPTYTPWASQYIDVNK